VVNKCCWNRAAQPCVLDEGCDKGGEGCRLSGTPTSQYGAFACNTTGQRQHPSVAATVPYWVLFPEIAELAPLASEEVCLGLHRAQSQEDLLAYHHLFYKRTGLILESGGFDPLLISTSYMFECLGWKAAHVEANPVAYARFPKARPNALTLNAAICDKPQTIHYVLSNQEQGTNGIYEFMVPEFKRQWYPNLDVNTLPTLICMPLAKLLAPFGIKKIDLWILDVEGAELSVLQGMDFNEIHVDAMIIETNRHAKGIYDVLVGKWGFVLYGCYGPNAVYVHAGFKPSSGPGKSNHVENPAGSPGGGQFCT